MGTHAQDMDLRQLMAIHVADEKDPAEVKAKAETAIAEWHARRRALRTHRLAHESMLSVLRDPPESQP